MSLEITNSVSRFFASVDRCDWPAVKALMTENFHVDYSSYGGGPASEVTPEVLTSTWAGFLPYFDGIHHQIGNLIIAQDGDTAKAQCHGMASHFIADHPGGDLQFIVGTYDLELKRAGSDWKLSSMRFNFKYASGNKTLATEAQRRAAENTKETSNV